MDQDAIKIRLRAFFTDHFPDRVLADDDDIFALGFGNSLFAMQLVEFIEAEFPIVIEPEDLEIANFASVDAITALVARKVSGDAARTLATG